MTRLSFALSDENAATELLASPQRKYQTKKLQPSGKEFDIAHEYFQLLHIALPSVLIQFSLFLTFPMAASVVGRGVGTTALAAFSLGGLLGNLTCLSIMEGALTAADTLMPRAYGVQKYQEVGMLAVRGTMVCIVLLMIPVIPLCWYSRDILVFLGQNVNAAALAHSWIQIYLIGVPPNLFFRVAMRFLLAQNRPWPLVLSSAIPCFLIHPFSLRYLVAHQAGLEGSAIAIVLTQWLTALLLLLYLTMFQPHKAETWSWKASFFLQSLRWKPLLEFFFLSVGGIFTMIEWWFFETMCFIAGTFGVVPLCIHTIAYNLVPLVFMLPLGILIGLTVRMGHLISEYPEHAKKLAAYCMGGTVTLGLLVAWFLFMYRYPVIVMFTNDPVVVDGSMQMWGRLCIYLFLLYIFGISQAILRALGMQWRLAAITSSYLYLTTLPAVVYFAVWRNGGIMALWTVLPISYAGLQILLAAGYLTVNWEQHGQTIRDGLLHRSLSDIIMIPTEESLLLVKDGLIKL